MSKTKIEWCDRRWNVFTGCEHTPEQCAVYDHCYARRMANRLRGRFGYDKADPFKPTFHADRLDEPIKVKKPQMFFVSTMGELFGEFVPREWIKTVLHIVNRCPQHTFLFLTKNPKRYYEFRFPRNVWLGTTVNSQADASRIDMIRPTDASVRYLSLEPLYGPIEASFENIDWIVIGAQSNPYKPPEKEWVEQLLDAFDGPIFLKRNLKWPEKTEEFPEVELP